MTRRDLLLGAMALADDPGFRLVDVTRRAGIDFRHHTGGFGAKYLPETMGPGCAFLDYDGDGWLDILLINGMDWPGHRSQRATMRLYRNNRNGTFTDVTREAGLDIEMYGLGVAVGDYDNDGFPDLFVTAVGQSRLFHNDGRGHFTDVTAKAGLTGHRGFSTSAMWFDYDRDGLLDLFVCNYVRWSSEMDVFCSFDGRNKSFCTPEAYRGTTCWLFRNKGDGRFEDVTAKSGLFDSSSKSLGVAMLDFDGDDWPDVFVANDTQPNKLYRNRRDGTFQERGVRLGVAFSDDGRARAGMGVDVAEVEGSHEIAVTNFDREMMALYRWNGKEFVDRAGVSGVASASRNTLGFGCRFADFDLDGRLDLLAVNGHIDGSVRDLPRSAQYAQSPHLFLRRGDRFVDVASTVGPEFAGPKVGRGLAIGDFDRDGSPDVLVTTNGGAANLYRTEVRNGNRSLRLYLEGRKSNRDAIGARVQVIGSAGTLGQTVRSGSSYLSSSEKALTFGMGRMDRADRVTIAWPSGRSDEHTGLLAGRSYRIVEGEKPKLLDGR